MFMAMRRANLQVQVIVVTAVVDMSCLGVLDLSDTSIAHPFCAH